MIKNSTLFIASIHKSLFLIFLDNEYARKRRNPKFQAYMVADPNDDENDYNEIEEEDFGKSVLLTIL